MRANTLLSILEITCLLVLLPLWAMAMPGFAPRRFLLFAGCAYALWRLYGTVSWRFLLAGPPKGWWRGPLLRGLLAGSAIAAYVLIFEPQLFFALPRNRPLLWVALLLLYPLLSAVPQEIIYRVYLFEAHPLLTRRPALAVIVSALLFGWVHIIYAGWFAVAASIPAGLSLAWNYAQNRARPGAFWPLALEHSLYGLLVFTLGLGKYFYLPR